MEGKLKVVTRAYTSKGKVTAEFVEGVLFRYTVTSD
jgi:mannitol/fructose-specific phosphotransferase system IIA component